MDDCASEVCWITVEVFVSNVCARPSDERPDTRTQMVGSERMPPLLLTMNGSRDAFAVKKMRPEYADFLKGRTKVTNHVTRLAEGRRGDGSRLSQAGDIKAVLQMPRSRAYLSSESRRPETHEHTGEVVDMTRSVP